MAIGNNPDFLVGCSAGGNIYGVYGYAGPGRDDAVGPEKNTYTQNAGVCGVSLQFTRGVVDGCFEDSMPPVTLHHLCNTT